MFDEATLQMAVCGGGEERAGRFAKAAQSGRNFKTFVSGREG